MKTVIVSGISGSGKTTFLKALEDAGYYCVDNFPLILLPKFIEVCELAEGKIDKAAFVVDIREREFFEEGRGLLGALKERHGVEIIFLDGSDEALMRRFRETRRSHPLLGTPNVLDALAEERKLVNWIREMADKVIDTTHLTPHDLRRFALKAFGQDQKRMKINLMSFGYSYGIPLEADMVLDVRFLPNPFFVEDLKEKTGLSEEVKTYIRSYEVYRKYFQYLAGFLAYLFPLFEKEGKSYLTVCLGCTGGKHRSVCIVNELEEHFLNSDYGPHISVIHRDMGR